MYVRKLCAKVREQTVVAHFAKNVHHKGHGGTRRKAVKFTGDNGGEFRLKKPERLMVCAECGVQVGTGHVMRCLALGQAWKRAGGDVIFLLPEGLAGIEERVRAEGLLLETLPEESGSSPDGFVRAALRAQPSYRCARWLQLWRD
jgi:hypothetical protein